jgi:hypothetical protein
MPKEKKTTSGHGQDSLEGSVLYCVSERPSDAINIIPSELPKENTTIQSQEVMQHTAELQPYHSDAILIKPQDHILRKCIDELNQANQHQKITDLASNSLCLELPTNLSDNSGVRPIEHGWTAEIVFESCKCSIPNNEGQQVAQPEAQEQPPQQVNLMTQGGSQQQNTPQEQAPQQENSLVQGDN